VSSAQQHAFGVVEAEVGPGRIPEQGDRQWRSRQSEWWRPRA
jgi:hypothetical protein